MTILEKIKIGFNMGLSTVGIKKSGIHIIRNLSLCYFSQSYLGKTFYITSSLFNLFSILGTLQCMQTKISPISILPLGNLALACVFEVGGSVVTRLGECENIEPSTLRGVCIDMLLQDAEVFKKYIPFPDLSLKE